MTTSGSGPVRNPGTAVVTGATGGIGRWTALGLAGLGYRVILLGRDEGRLRAAAAFVSDRVPGALPDILRADLSSLADTRAAAATLSARHDRLAVLVNNAGILCPRRTETLEGHELTLAVNHLAPFLLTTALAPLLAAGGDRRGRVVMVGSSTADRASIDPDDLELRRRWRMTRAYARSKLAMQLCAVERAPALAATGVHLNVVHPGLVATDLVRAGGIDEFVWRRLIRPFALHPRDGAAGPVHAAAAPELDGISGLYLKRLLPARPNRRVRDPALRSQVLRETERLLGDPPPS